MSEHTAEERKAREFFDNCWAGSGAVTRAASRLVDACPGIDSAALMLAVLAAFDGLDDEGKLRCINQASIRDRAGLAAGALLDDDDDDEQPTPEPTADASLATVRVGTRIVDLRPGETQSYGVVVEVWPECVIAELANGRPSRAALRYPEFAVEPRDPVAAADGEGVANAA